MLVDGAGQIKMTKDGKVLVDVRPKGLQNYQNIITQRAQLRGFIVYAFSSTRSLPSSY